MFQDKGIRKFIIISAIIGLTCIVITWFLSLNFKMHSFIGVYMIIFLVMATTIILHAVLVAASKKAPIKFINKFMALSGLKLFFYFLIILAYIYFIKQDIILFLCAFLIVYLLYTILEISSILSYLKKN
jgi:hypothetical protein